MSHFFLCWAQRSLSCTLQFSDRSQTGNLFFQGFALYSVKLFSYLAWPSSSLQMLSKGASSNLMFFFKWSSPLGTEPDLPLSESFNWAIEAVQTNLVPKFHKDWPTNLAFKSALAKYWPGQIDNGGPISKVYSSPTEYTSILYVLSSILTTNSKVEINSVKRTFQRKLYCRKPTEIA